MTRIRQTLRSCAPMILLSALAASAAFLAGCATSDDRRQTVPTPSIAVATLTRAAAQVPAIASIPATATVPPAHPTDTPAPTGTPVAVPASSVTSPASPSPTPAPTTVSASPTARPGALRLTLQPVASDFAQPVFVTHAGDGSGRLFVLEKPGVIRVGRAGVISDTPFLDIRDRVRSRGSEQGLLGLAFPPGYAQKGYFLVNYTGKSGDTVVSRFALSADPDAADPASEREIIRIAQPAANHNGGMLAFGPDGYLWIGTGDGGGAGDQFGNGQNPKTLLGKLLRIDVRDEMQPYGIPPDNPWIRDAWNGQEVPDEIWAVGLRNPWRYSFDRATGDLWIGDVGQGRWEEIDVVPAGSRGGLNFGWPIMEGTHCFDSSSCSRTGTVPPVAEYEHRDGNCSVTAGYVYRGQAIPALAGSFLYGDYCSGRIWALSRSGDAWQSRELMDSPLNISAFGEDEAGEVYVVDLNGGIYRITG